MNEQEMLRYYVKRAAQAYDEDFGMLAVQIKNLDTGYHSRQTGLIHPNCYNGIFAQAVLCTGYEPEYEHALGIVERLCDTQDTRENGPFFGLWSNNQDEPLDQMIVPDFNRADFINRFLQHIICESKCPIPEALRQKILKAIRNAAVCTMRRNVGLDYSNIIAMTCLTLVRAGEILEDAQIMAFAKRKMRLAVEYLRFNGAWSEYNSSGYVLTIMDAVSSMLQTFQDPECLEMAKEMSWYAWRQLAQHYNMTLGQLTPPQARSYIDVENGDLAWQIWRGTKGKYGWPVHVDMDLPFNIQTSEEHMIGMLLTPLDCPEDLYPLFEETERFIADTYYKKNTIRDKDEDFTIIREWDSPDLTAYSYQTPKFSMGAFSLCDTWVQRRNCMVVWDKEKPKVFRIRSIEGNYDFCGGVTYAQQKDNQILGQVGLVTDRGTFHFILDKVKNGIYNTDALYFQFTLGGACEDLTIRQDGKDFFVEDGELTIKLHIEKWLYDGKDAPVYVSADGKSVILEGYKGEKTMLDTNILGETCGVFTMTVEDPTHKAVEAPLSWELADGKLSSRWGELAVESPAKPVPYRTALGLD